MAPLGRAALLLAFGLVLYALVAVASFVLGHWFFGRSKHAFVDVL